MIIVTKRGTKNFYHLLNKTVDFLNEYGGGVEHLGRCELNTLVAVN